ncbi:MAG: InlB B-repeat-containing protein [Clostridia bacterium]|nr:InlB B-repeat-containing protein [Clostridia bacterium]
MKAKKWACIATAAVMTASLAAIFAGCGDTDADKLTVTWYNGRNELKKEEVESGAKVTDWTPTRDGYEFKGWYEEASLSTKFDFNKAITENTSIYSSWLKTEYVADSNEYYAIGTGAGTLKDSGWSHAPESAALHFTKNEAVTNANEYTVELSMYAGDRFQITPGSWSTGRAGIGNFEGVEYADFEVGQNPYKPDVAGTAADQDYAVVKNDKGEVVFHGGNENGDAATNWNIIVTEGHDGKYKFTYHTYPGQEGNNYITWELKEALQPMAETHKMYLVGTYKENVSDWQDPATDRIYFNKNEDGTFSYFLTVTSAMFPSWGDGEHAEVKIKNEISGSDYGDNGGSANIKLGEGTWCITYNPDGNKVAYAKCDYYVVGTFLDGTNAVNFSVKDGVTPKLTTADNGATYTVTFTAEDVTGNSAYSWMKDQNKPGVCAIKVVFGCDLGIKDWFADNAHNGDNFYLTAGEHTVTLTVDGGAVTVS